MEKSEYLKKKGINFERYDYSLVPNILTLKTYITIICKKHNFRFTQLAQNHLIACGCKLCNSENQISKRTKTKEEFIKQANKVWNNKYDYSESNYINSNKYITIRCPIHNLKFQQIANQHLRKHEGCPECKKENYSNIYKQTKEEFIQKANIVWNKINILFDRNFKFDYSESEYNHSQKYIKIKCLNHNIIFKQNPHGHLQGHIGCPLCKESFNISKNEKEIGLYLKKEYNMEIEENNRNILENNQELDIYIPDKKIAIEFDGLHYHSELFKDKDYHINKTIECESKRIQLIHIFENEWKCQRNIVESRLSQILGKSKYKLYARKCYIKQIPLDEERIFLEQNHLQGYIASQICYGLYYKHSNGKEYLVSLMSFGKVRKALGAVKFDDWELYRFCNKINFSIPGAASKLFKHFLNKFQPKKIISYANRRWSINNEHNLYRQLRFEFDSYTEPNYFYINGYKLINRFNLRKDILVSKYGCPKEMSEHDFCYSQGWHRIYDCGNIKYIWKKPNK